ncbi:hypothetical protein KIM372_06130 [Bombiscardovia nodaiensis]|uniref:Uncharacterized protein n=1 Tax=Bombiscardovia nodaiensis TaxID=2932181 RepID=A0ABM8B7R5_9BIFI|nr:hypothetical protein KIM372_06130 [Bombiscardovia nodaiensis]
MAGTFRIMAVVFFSLAVVFACAAVLLYFALHIRQVHNTLTGKTAQRKIQELQKSRGRWALDYEQADRRSNLQVPAEVDGSELSLRGGGTGGVDSAKNPQTGKNESDLGTTLLVAATTKPVVGSGPTAGGSEGQEEGTSLLGERSKQSQAPSPGERPAKTESETTTLNSADTHRPDQGQATEVAETAETAEVTEAAETAETAEATEGTESGTTLLQAKKGR